MYLVFDIGGTAIKYAYLNDEGEIFDRNEFSSKSLTSLDLFIKTLSDIYHQSDKDIKGIALACPGVIDAKNGIIEIISAYPYLAKICLTEKLSKACNDIKVTLENDGKCAGLAETWIGHAAPYQDAIVVVFGTGIGGAIIKDKKIHHGAHRLAGEISTLMSHYDIKQGTYITWSELCSTKGLCRIVSKRLNKPIDEVNGHYIFEQANLNHEVILEILDQYYMDIAVQLYNLQYMYDPDIICIGGGISKQERVLNGIKKALNDLNESLDQLLLPQVATCKYFNDANLIGALYHYKQIS